MPAAVVCLVLFLAMTGHSSASYCVCNNGLSTSDLQKDIDYACGAGANCSPILQNGSCYNPNTVPDHCNYAVNSYYQLKGQVPGSCNFSGTASVVTTLTSSNSACVYPSSSSTAGTITTPSTTTSPITGTTPSSTTTPSTTTTTTTPSSSIFGLAPNSGISTTDSSASVTLHQNTHSFWSLTLIALLFSGPMLLRL